MVKDGKLSITLNGSWKFHEIYEKDYNDAIVPGSVLRDMLDNNKIQDPFWRSNEEQAKILGYKDYVYERCFQVNEEALSCHKLELVCYGLDTLAEIYINKELLAKTDNMHRTWCFEVRDKLKLGENNIAIIFRAPLKFIEDKVQNSDITYTATGSLPGNGFLRKAHCMFGWDWGPQLPDAGIWRDIAIEGYNFARFSEVYITQQHLQNKAELKIKVETQQFKELNNLEAHCKITGPNGQVLSSVLNCLSAACINLIVDNPELWWPNGLGGQPLYKVDIALVTEGKVVDNYSRNIGLRTLTVSQDKDQWGKEFAFKINGEKIFAMGADYIPKDSILSRIDKAGMEELIKACVAANFNCIRVWGGAYYPEDYFYDLCDEYGLIVWQDLMFACNIYHMTEEFADNITKETIDNVKRIRNHACLGLWCGNNEMEWAWDDWDRVKFHDLKYKADYIKQFEALLPMLLKKYDSETFYWPASPSSGGCFDKPNDENYGDVHNWSVWHGLQPFTYYRNFHYRFCSEFGFESFPCAETVKTFTLEKDRNIFSKVMEDHQRCSNGNGKILYYLSENYMYPKDFESMLYVSQLLQMEAVRYGVEHWRRNRGRCMGAIYWQLNDCWPVASWSSIDYFGRWKALHYGAKRFFAPLMVSIEEEDTLIKVYVHNETLKAKTCQLQLSVKNKKFSTLVEKTMEVTLDKLSASMVYEQDFAELLKDYELKSECFFEAKLLVEEKVESLVTHSFVKVKHFNFDKAVYIAKVEEDEHNFVISIKSSSYAKYVEISLEGYDCTFSHNYFDISSKAGVKVYLEKQQVNIDMNKIIEIIKIKSIVDTY